MSHSGQTTDARTALHSTVEAWNQSGHVDQLESLQDSVETKDAARRRPYIANASETRDVLHWILGDMDKNKARWLDENGELAVENRLNELYEMPGKPPIHYTVESLTRKLHNIATRRNRPGGPVRGTKMWYLVQDTWDYLDPVYLENLGISRPDRGGTTHGQDEGGIEHHEPLQSGTVTDLGQSAQVSGSKEAAKGLAPGDADELDAKEDDKWYQVKPVKAVSGKRKQKLVCLPVRAQEELRLPMVVDSAAQPHDGLTTVAGSSSDTHAIETYIDPQPTSSELLQEQVKASKTTEAATLSPDLNVHIEPLSIERPFRELPVEIHSATLEALSVMDEGTVSQLGLLNSPSPDLQSLYNMLCALPSGQPLLEGLVGAHMYRHILEPEVLWTYRSLDDASQAQHELHQPSMSSMDKILRVKYKTNLDVLRRRAFIEDIHSDKRSTIVDEASESLSRVLAEHITRFSSLPSGVTIKDAMAQYAEALKVLEHKARLFYRNAIDMRSRWSAADAGVEFKAVWPEAKGTVFPGLVLTLGGGQSKFRVAPKPAEHFEA